jgi:diguanylate cyclase (GGDEF)-like protein
MELAELECLFNGDYLMKNLRQNSTNDYREELRFFLWQQNIHHILIFSLLGLLIESMAFGYVYKAGLSCYIPLYVTLFLIYIVFLPVIIYFNNKKNEKLPRYSSWFLFFYFLGLLTFAVMLSFANQIYTGTITVYVIVLFCIASFFYIPFPHMIAIFSAAQWIFVTFLPKFQHNPVIARNHIFNSFAALVLALVISRLTYQMKTKTFMNKKIIDKQIQTLKNLSIKDGMTDLFNHKHICRRLEEEIRRANRYKTPLSVGIFDMDGFKNINDTFGHQEGDRIIIKATETMKQTFRETDLLGRYGGDEFLVIFPETPLGNAVKAAERFREKILQNIAEKDKTISISGGITFLQKEDTLQSLIHRADMLLYDAKNAGKNKIAW